MPRRLAPWSRLRIPLSFARLFKPALDALSSVTLLRSRTNKPMTFTFEHHLKALVYFHLQEYESGRELLQALQQDDFARAYIAPPEGVSRNSFFEAMNNRALEQLSQMYHLLQGKAKSFCRRIAVFGGIEPIMTSGGGIR